MDNGKASGFSLSMLDVAILLYSVHEGVRRPDVVGFEDADQTLEELTERLSARRFIVSKDVLESALWSANLMDEAGLFWNPNGSGFETWVKDLLKRSGHAGSRFDRVYNRILDAFQVRSQAAKKGSETKKNS